MGADEVDVQEDDKNDADALELELGDAAERLKGWDVPQIERKKRTTHLN